jgi:TonB family protein
MTPVFNYFITASVYLTVFYIFYQLLLSSDTHYRRNRIFLLSSILLSVLLPLIKIQMTGGFNIVNLNTNITDVILIDQVNVNASGYQNVFTVLKALSAIYFSGLILALSILTYDLFKLWRMVVNGKEKNTRIVYTDSDRISGFSAFGYIFLNRSLSPKEILRISEHEQTHIEYLHFADLLLIRIVSVILWFNPLIYLFQVSLKAVHEYQADARMLDKVESTAGYQQMIMNQLFKTNIFTIQNAFAGNSLIKKRMIMMTKKRSTKSAGIKPLFVLPLILLFFIGFSCSSENADALVLVEEDLKASETISKPVEKSETDLKEVLEDKEVFYVVENMPTFNGGDIDEFRQWVHNRVQYPKIAAENGIQGKVEIEFVINDDGTVSDVKISKAVDPSLDNEALRVVKSSPNWVSGKQRGTPVNVKYSMTVNFLLK